MSRQRCCLTPMVFNEDERLFCHMCGTTFVDRAPSLAERLLSNATPESSDNEIGPRVAIDPKAVLARVLAEMRRTS